MASLFQNFLKTIVIGGESYDVFSPSTNNSLERFNLTIKDKYVPWRRLAIKEFVNVALNILTGMYNEKPVQDKMIYRDDESIIYNFVFIPLTNNENKNYYLVNPHPKRCEY